jgi:hypothetical protein
LRRTPITGQECGCRILPSSPRGQVGSTHTVQRRALRLVAAKHSQTAHVPLTIYYPHHPQFGQTVTIVRRVSFSGQHRHQVQLLLPSGDQLVVPEWMLDEEHCRGMSVVERPLVALSALLTLRSLIDAKRCDTDPHSSLNSEASSLGGACCEPTTSGTSSLGEAQPPTASTDGTGALSRVAQPDAARNRERHNIRRGGER